MPDSTLAGLRRLVASLESGTGTQATENKQSFPGQWVSTGHAGLDHALGGGFACGALHELFAATPSDSGPLRGIAAAIAALATDAGSSGSAESGRPVLWITQAMTSCEAGAPYAPGLALMGLPPERLVLVRVPDTAALLSCVTDAAASGTVAAVVAETWGSPPAIDLSATRRLMLAARCSNTLVILTRLGAKPAPSAAETRWRVAAAPSRPLAARAPGLPVFDLTLLRHRRGISGAAWRVAWMCHEHQFQPISGFAAASHPALSGGLAAPPAHRSSAVAARGLVLRLAG